MLIPGLYECNIDSFIEKMATKHFFPSTLLLPVMMHLRVITRDSFLNRAAHLLFGMRLGYNLEIISVVVVKLTG